MWGGPADALSKPEGPSPAGDAVRQATNQWDFYARIDLSAISKIRTEARLYHGLGELASGGAAVH
jgi:hypothetical protein